MSDDVFRDNDQSRQAAPESDNVRDVVTWQDSTTFSMTLPEVLARFVDAGLDRSLRTLQRYCEQGHLRASKYPTDTGAVWYVDPDSVEIKIEEIRQVQESLRQPSPPRRNASPSTDNEASRHDADRRAMSDIEDKDDSGDMSSATSDDELRQQGSVADRRASNDNFDQRHNRERQKTTVDDEKYVTVPVMILDALTRQLAAKDDQIKRRDSQMEQLAEAHDKDRQLLGAALAIIHNDDFSLELEDGLQQDQATEPQPAEEIKPEFGSSVDNLEPPPSGVGV